MSNKLLLPLPDRRLELYSLSEPRRWEKPKEPMRSRIVYAAAHVVADPLAGAHPTEETAIDWEATLAFRHHLWSYGLGVAEAMDTSQRGMGLDWVAAKELISRSIGEAKAVGGLIACGAGTDNLPVAEGLRLEDIERAYEEECEFVERLGGRVILMASRALARVAKGPEDYLRVYGRVLSGLANPAILHWLGEMFDPQLSGYWGSTDITKAMNVCLTLIEEHQDKIDGIKISLLDKEKEVEMRRRLPLNVRMYTGDDFHYDELIRGDEHGHSDALLGIFDAIAPAASVALQALDQGDTGRFSEILGPTVPLSRLLFERPTYYYKTGIVFLAYLNGHQSHFRMVRGAESARSIIHLAELFRLTDRAGLLENPELAVNRMGHILALAGITE